MNSIPSKILDSQESQIIEEKIVKPSGEILSKKYSKGRFLGKGGFARVYEFLSLDNKQIYAGKIINKSSLTRARARQKLMSEIKIHRSLCHLHIVKFEHFFEDSENVYILLELCTNQTLNELIRRRKRLTEIELQCFTLQIISALKYLHAHKVIHRDIKLGNLLLTDKMEIKIGDLGLATKLEFDGERKRTICGTPNYIAPEILDGRSGHSFEVDVWSLGVLLYTMTIGKPPFETNDVKLTYRRIKMNTYCFPENISISDDLKELISSILVSDPSQRPTLDELQNSRFLTRNPIPKLLPASILAVPPSSSYLKQFEPGCTPKEEIRLARPPRSCSQTRISEDLKNSIKEGKLTDREIRSTSRTNSRAESGSSGSSSANRKTASVSAYSFVQNGPRVWVKKWVDYSNKYGLAYMMSNGCAGVYFNDSTKIISSSNKDFFQYISKQRGNKEEETEEYSYSNFPKDLNKKVTLLDHFKKHLAINSVLPTDDKDLVYVKKWTTTEHAIIFRFSNKLVQVCFLDKSELLLCSESKMVSYVDKRGVSNVFPLGSAMDSQNKELAKRLRYTKEILVTMMQGVTGEPRPNSRNEKNK